MKSLKLAIISIAFVFFGCGILNDLPTDQVVQCGMTYCSDQPCEANTMSCDQMGSCSCTIQVWPDQPVPEPPNERPIIIVNPPEPHHEPEPRPRPEPPHHDKEAAPTAQATPTGASK